MGIDARLRSGHQNIKLANKRLLNDFSSNKGTPRFYLLLSCFDYYFFDVYIVHYYACHVIPLSSSMFLLVKGDLWCVHIFSIP